MVPLVVFQQLAKLGGFRTLSSVAKDTNEPAFTSQVIYLHRLYMEYLQSAKMAQLVSHENLTLNQHSKGEALSLRTRAYSTSSVSSTGTGPAGGQSSFRAGGLNSSAAQARLYTLSAGASATSGSAANLNLHTSSAASVHPSSSLLYANELDAGEDASMATKGLNLAFNFVSELLK